MLSTLFFFHINIGLIKEHTSPYDRSNGYRMFESKARYGKVVSDLNICVYNESLMHGHN